MKGRVGSAEKEHRDRAGTQRITPSVAPSFQILRDMDEPTDEELLEEVAQRKRPKAPKARSYLEEQVQPYIKSFNWQNETLQNDMKAFWVAIHRLNKYKPTYFKETLEWAAKNKLHPLAFVKAVNTILKKK